jgi:hypothetical protein
VSSTWQRFVVVRTQANPVIGFRLQTLGDGIEVDFACFEPGDFPTSPILTTATPGIRASDSVIVNSPAWYNGVEGSWMTEFMMPQVLDLNELNALQADDGTNTNRQVISATNGADVRIRSLSTPSSLTFALGVTSASTIEKVAYGYKDLDHAGVRNGGTIFTDNTTLVPPGINRLNIGRGAGTHYMNSYMRRLFYYNKRLSNAKLQALTT